MIGTSKRLIIYEGPDGGGKSTAAKRFAAETGAHYFHLGPFVQVQKHLARLYVEAMMPAVLGHCDVVMDRCWLSELPYGIAFRGGQDRLGPEGRRMLERLALRCKTTLVLALPPLAEVEQSFMRRKGKEYLAHVDQLRQVYDWYNMWMETSLPKIVYDYTKDLLEPTRLLYTERTTIPHPLGYPTAGNWNASILLVGERFAERHEADTLYQWPFGALSGGGGSRWLARRMEEMGIPENCVLWINADAQEKYLRVAADSRRVVSLGHPARDRLEGLGIPIAAAFHHPQSWKRFNNSEPYPLLDWIKENVA